MDKNLLLIAYEAAGIEPACPASQLEELSLVAYCRRVSCAGFMQGLYMDSNRGTGYPTFSSWFSSGLAVRRELKPRKP